MIVRPKALEMLNTSFEAHERCLARSNDAPLLSDASYVVYAISTLAGSELFLCDDDRDRFPSPYPAAAFEIVDGRISGRWRVAHSKSGLLLAFAAWASDDTFYERLIDDDPEAQSQFDAERSVMDLEFARPEITARAIALGDQWLQCPLCDEAWGELPAGEMTRCANVQCYHLLLVPLGSDSTDLSPATETIHVLLLDEGTDVWRPTQARRLSGMQFEILPTPDYDPQVEAWQFEPGSVVVCEERVLGGQVSIVAVRAL